MNVFNLSRWEFLLFRMCWEVKIYRDVVLGRSFPVNFLLSSYLVSFFATSHRVVNFLPFFVYMHEISFTHFAIRLRE